MDFDIIAYLVERCRQRFVESGNPLHVWAAYRLTRRRVVPTLGPGGLFSMIKVAPTTVPTVPLPLPKWIQEYLDVCANRLLSGEEPADALLLKTYKGGHGYHTQFINFERDQNIAAFVDMMVSLDPADAVEVVENLQLYGEDVDDFVRLLKCGKPTIDRICLFVAHQTEHTDNRFSDKRLTFEMVRSTYYSINNVQ